MSGHRLVDGRVPGTATVSRFVSIPLAAILLPAFVYSIQMEDISPYAVVVGATITAVALWAAIRSLFLGVWMKGDLFVARTWWRRIEVPKAQLASCVTVGYFGALTEGWRVEYLRELEVGFTDFRTIRLSGTVSVSGAATRHRQAILSFIQRPD